MDGKPWAKSVGGKVAILVGDAKDGRVEISLNNGFITIEQEEWNNLPAWDQPMSNDRQTTWHDLLVATRKEQQAHYLAERIDAGDKARSTVDNMERHGRTRGWTFPL